MKIQKLIEVEVCENCGEELHAKSDMRECDCCKKKMCYQCAESVSIRVTHSTPKPYVAKNGEYYRMSTCYQKEHSGRFCTDCAYQITEALAKFGIVKEAEPVDTGLEV